MAVRDALSCLSVLKKLDVIVMLDSDIWPDVLTICFIIINISRQMSGDW